jgi:hypothetical protein
LFACFAVADDGYGVSYIIVSDEIIFFHITSKKNSVAVSLLFSDFCFVLLFVYLID